MPTIARIGTRLRELLPYINFVIGTTALTFQVKVLYPWHQQLDQDFEKLKDEQNEKLFQYHKYKLVALNKIEEDLTDLKTQQKQIFKDKLQLKDVN
jgi:hypothetical protein